MPRHAPFWTVAVALSAGISTPGAPAAEEPGLESARASWEDRALGFDGEWASSERIATVVESLEAILRETPDRLDVRVELLRALRFKGAYTEISEEERLTVWQTGVDLADASLARIHGEGDLKERKVEELVAEGETEPLAGPLHFWAAVHWGSWGDVHPPMAALRKGVAKRLRVHANVALELSPDYDEAGPYRFLGRMHAIAPKVPMFTGWIDRDTGVEMLEEAVARAPEHPENRLFLAESWLDRRPEKKADAQTMLRDLVSREPRAGLEVEDDFALDQAKRSWEGVSPDSD